MMDAPTLTVGSLFSGIGGLDLGMERAGMRVAWQCEIDKAASTVLARHWPDVPNIGDVRDVGHSTPSVDVVCGGFPCQDVSVAGRRAGLAGERSGLWFEFRRVVGDLRPRWVVIENVPGLLSSNGGRDFTAVLRGLVECGYGVAWRVLDAQFFGVAQRRRRVFIVGSLGDGRAAQVLFEREGVPGDSPPRRETGARVARALANGSGSSGYRYDPNEEEYVVQDVAPAIRASGQGTQRAGDSRGQDPLVIAHTLRARGAQASEDGTGRGVPLVIDGRNGTLQDDIATTLQACGLGAGRGGNPNATPLVTSFQSRYYTRDNKTGGAPSTVADITNAHKAGDSAPLIYHENKGASVTPAMHERALRAGASHSYQMAQTACGVRRLTPRECERLQGFPDDWTAGQSDSSRYRQLGNAVAVPVAEWIARRIVAVESEAA